MINRPDRKMILSESQYNKQLYEYDYILCIDIEYLL
jgi:hypothetical protein